MEVVVPIIEVLALKFSKQTSLFRYRAWGDQTRFESEVDLIRDERIWCTLPMNGELNDPFDCMVPVKTKITEVEAKKILDQIGRGYNHTRKERRRALSRKDLNFVREVGAFVRNAQDVINRIPICCFSSDPTNFLLWSHYANSHKGMCIEYVRSPQNGLGSDLDTRKVEYTKQIEWEIEDLINIATLGDEAVSNSALFHSALFCKTEEWEYEQEYRFCGGVVEGTNKSPGAIVSITFGMSMGLAEREYVTNSVGPSVQLWEIKRIEDTFQIGRHRL